MIISAQVNIEVTGGRKRSFFAIFRKLKLPSRFGANLTKKKSKEKDRFLLGKSFILHELLPPGINIICSPQVMKTIIGGFLPNSFR